MATFVYVGQQAGAYSRVKTHEGFKKEPIPGETSPREFVSYRLENKQSLKFVRGEPTEVTDAKFAERLRKNSHFKEVIEAAPVAQADDTNNE